MNERKEQEKDFDFEKMFNKFLSFLLLFCIAIMLLIGYYTKTKGDALNYFNKTRNQSQFIQR
ncbi:hypothetical protein KA977_14630 [Candidatus Dependentiae bacterium]|nr:hypothetical protein [Candidatus Dependentiae bacterium]